jgi:hypothetical protein
MSVVALTDTNRAKLDALRAIKARHQQDDVWFRAGHHDPNGYIGMAHADRAALLAMQPAAVSHETPPVLMPLAHIKAEGTSHCPACGLPIELWVMNPCLPAPTMSIPKAAWDWLMGQGPDDEGYHFGENVGTHFGSKPRQFWWRITFRRMCGL